MDTTPLHIFQSSQRTAMSGRVLNISEAKPAATASICDPKQYEALNTNFKLQLADGRHTQERC
ncbi:hypothetical protein ACFPTO_23660 [Paraburkholderia denitrificans]|uniref:Uncharacterized protein n=1 Tax=Paraburkholderia denitrificans TaxID=694025 RepID=A0ABW0JFV7_9BURK